MSNYFENIRNCRSKKNKRQRLTGSANMIQCKQISVTVNSRWICHSSLITVKCMQSHANKLSVTFLINSLPNNSWSFQKTGGEKSTYSNFKLPHKLLMMPEGFWHTLEKLTISEMARYPEGTAKRKKALHIKTHHRNELWLFSNGFGVMAARLPSIQAFLRGLWTQDHCYKTCSAAYTFDLCILSSESRRTTPP